MFKPEFIISSKVLSNIKRITILVNSLNNKRFSKPVLMELINRAHEISAFSSTSIEGNPLPLTEVKRLIKTLPKNVRDSEKEVLNYNNSLIYLEKIVNQGEVKFNLDLILLIHKKTMSDLMIAEKVGKLRKEPVFVNDFIKQKPIYLPPDHKDVPVLMVELLDFINKNKGEIDPIILAGLWHKQFVIIHPFLDGNGRTARLTSKVLLSLMGLNTFNLFSFENYYNKNVTNYFKHVGVLGDYYEVKDMIDFTSWLEYFTDGIIDELLRVSKILQEKEISPKTILKAQHKVILDYIKKNGYITDRIYSTLTKRAKPTRNQDFNMLIDLGLIKRMGKGRSTIYKMN